MSEYKPVIEVIAQEFDSLPREVTDEYMDQLAMLVAIKCAAHLLRSGDESFVQIGSDIVAGIVVGLEPPFLFPPYIIKAILLLAMVGLVVALSIL